MIQHLNIKIFGQVQGVFFRNSAKEMADNLNITGFARNEPDNSVYIEAEGEEKDLNKFLDWCKKGSDFARVKKVEVNSGEVQNFKDFQIL